MNLADYIGFAKANPICSVATVDEDQPRVRIFMLWRADESGFYLCTGTPKAVCQQLIRNPKIELCFYKPGEGPNELGDMMRVAGRVEFVADTALRTELLDEWPFLKEMGITGPDDPMLSLMLIRSGTIRYWTVPAPAQEHEEVLEF